MSKYNSMNEKRDEMEADYDAYLESEDVTVDGAKERLEAIKGVNAEIEKFMELEKSRNEMKSAAKARSEFRSERPFGFENVEKPNKKKSYAEAFTDSEAYKSFQKGEKINQNVSLSIKDAPVAPVLVRGTNGYSQQEPGINPVGLYPLGIADLFAQSTTSSTSVTYLRQNPFTRYSTTVAEGAQKPYANNTYAKYVANVEKVAVVEKVTDETLADIQETQSFLSNILQYDVLSERDSLCLTGTGNSPQYLGLLNVPGTLTRARGSDTAADAIFKATTSLRKIGYKPDYVVMTPEDWEPIRLSKGTGDGQYLFGPAGLIGLETVFGLPVLVNSSMPTGTCIVGQWKVGGTYYTREGIRVEMTNSNSNDFELNLISMRVEIRGTLAIKRPDAFCIVTGLDA